MLFPRGRGLGEMRAFGQEKAGDSLRVKGGPAFYAAAWLAQRMGTSPWVKPGALTHGWRLRLESSGRAGVSAPESLWPGLTPRPFVCGCACVG